MTVSVALRSDLPRAQGKPLYRRDELGLVYEATQVRERGKNENLSDTLDQRFGVGGRSMVFVIADTLTLTFDERDRRFVSLDAYTNSAKWKQTSEPAPVDEHAGALVLTDPRQADRITLDIIPQYRFNPSEATLSIALGPKASAYFAIGDDLFAGILHGELSELVLTNVTIE
jgi:hypothetical protein